MIWTTILTLWTFSGILYLYYFWTNYKSKSKQPMILKLIVTLIIIILSPLLFLYDTYIVIKDNVNR